MERGGPAWRGWFPLGGELTSGRPDGKEGFYVGGELPASDPRVQAGTPLHGTNLFPAELPELGPVVLAYVDALTQLGHALLDRKSVVEGKSVSVRVDLGGRRIIQKTTKKIKI